MIDSCQGGLGIYIEIIEFPTTKIIDKFKSTNRHGEFPATYWFRNHQPLDLPDLPDRARWSERWIPRQKVEDVARQASSAERRLENLKQETEAAEISRGLLQWSVVSHRKMMGRYGMSHDFSNCRIPVLFEYHMHVFPSLLEQQVSFTFGFYFYF